MKFSFRILILFSILFFAGCGGSGFLPNKGAPEILESRSGGLGTQTTPDSIVLMLPLKGELAATSRAIRNGFLASYYYFRKQYPNINIKVIDTTNADIKTLYREVVAGGADVIVGPLTKSGVEEILGFGSLPVPIIALNTLDNYYHNYAVNLYQFGLLPQDEAMQVADRMIEEHYDQAAVIFPENSWGDKIASTFKQQYEAQGGAVVAALNYKSSLNLSEQVCNFLAQDPTELCAPRRKRKKTDSSESLRRQDINAIFLVAPADKAQQIVPLLKFYYADDLPVFSISSVFGGVSNPNLDQDINGVYFCDIPWVVKKPETLSGELQAIHNKINTLYPNSSSYNRLYALGIDAYKLAIELNSLLDGSEVGIRGATGTLYLDNYNHVYRKLQWVQMRDGSVSVLQ